MKPEKRTPPATSIVFLGIQLDTQAQVASLPQEKLTGMLQELRAFSASWKCTKQSLLSLIGKLAFAAKAIPAGRIFVRRLIDASTRVRLLRHHLRISAAMAAYIKWWLSFAANWNSTNFFLDHAWTPSPAFQLYTDAGNQRYGCFWKGHWIAGEWSAQQQRHSIQWKELCAVAIAAKAWGTQWSKKRLLVHCNNQAVVDVWHSGTSRDAALMCLVRTLFFTAATHDFTLVLQHIEGVNNGIADAISPAQFHRFRRLAPEADNEPTPTPAMRIST